jgi:hypothetical protein
MLSLYWSDLGAEPHCPGFLAMCRRVCEVDALAGAVL